MYLNFKISWIVVKELKKTKVDTLYFSMLNEEMK